MSLPPNTLLKAPQEKLAPDYLEKYFHLIQTNLPIADYWNTYAITHDLIMVESKIGNDGVDLPRLMDELTRMNYVEYQDSIKHAVWLWNVTLQRAHMNHTGWHHITTLIVHEQFDQFCDRFRSLCYQANVYPHIVKTKAKYVAKMKDIFKGTYDSPLQIHKQPSQKLSEEAALLAWFKGITEKNSLYLQHAKNQEDFYDRFGRNKDGQPKKKALDAMQYVARMYSFCQRLLEGG